MSDHAEHLIRFEVTRTKSDVYRSVFYASLHAPAFYVLSALPAGVVYLILDLGRVPHRELFTLAAYIWFIFLIPSSHAKRNIKEPGMLGPINYVLSPDGIFSEHCNAANEADWTATTSWALITGATETRKYVFIHLARDKFHLIPKAQLVSKQIEMVRTILRERIAKNIKLFAV